MSRPGEARMMDAMSGDPVCGVLRPEGVPANRGAAPAAAPAPFIVNFHGVGSVRRPYEAGEEPYWLSRPVFEDLLDWAQDHPHRHRIAITFDDGNDSDYTIAAPALARRGIPASFFVLAGRWDDHGFLSRTQARELSAAGFEIGSHGFDHVDWTRADDRTLARETRDSKAAIEDVIGCEVRRVAIPFGRYDRRVLASLRLGQYSQALCSDGTPRLSAMWPTPRRSVRQDGTRADLARLLEEGSRSSTRMRTEVRMRLKAIIRRKRFSA